MHGSEHLYSAVNGRTTLVPADNHIGAIPRTVETELLNRAERSTPMAGEAEVKYLDGDFRVIRPGAFVRCAVTGVAIPLEELKYWSVDLQEPYANPEAVLRRHFPDAKRRAADASR